MYVNHHQDDWVDWLPILEFSYNNKIQSSPGYSPFFVNHGHHPNSGSVIFRHSTNKAATAFASRMKKICEDCRTALVKARDTTKWFYDKKKGVSHCYTEGDLVWVERTNIPSLRPRKKLDNKRIVPFPIVKKVRAGAYKI